MFYRRGIYISKLHKSISEIAKNLYQYLEASSCYSPLFRTLMQHTLLYSGLLLYILFFVSFQKLFPDETGFKQSVYFLSLFILHMISSSKLLFLLNIIENICSFSLSIVLLILYLPSRYIYNFP